MYRPVKRDDTRQDPFNISGTAELTDFTFGVLLEHNECYGENEKVRLKGRALSHMTCC